MGPAEALNATNRRFEAGVLQPEAFDTLNPVDQARYVSSAEPTGKAKAFRQQMAQRLDAG